MEAVWGCVTRHWNVYSRVFMIPTLLLFSTCKRRRCEVPYNCLDDVPHFMKRRAADDAAKVRCVCKVGCAVLVAPPFVSSSSLQACNDCPDDVSSVVKKRKAEDVFAFRFWFPPELSLPNDDTNAGGGCCSC